MGRLRAIGAYIFAGGFTEGVKKHFDVLGHLEDGPYGTETSLANHEELLFIAKSPNDWLDPKFWATIDVDFVYCNPPCAAWSQAGTKPRKSGKRDYTNGFDPRDKRPACFENCVSLLELARPRVLAVESVQGAWSKGRPFIERQAARARELGYGLDVVLFDAFDAGLPQRRKRAFFVFTTLELDWTRPDVAGPRTVRETFEWAFGADADPKPENLNVSDAYLELLRDTPEGGRLMDAYHRAFGNSRYDDVKQRYVGRPSFLHRRLRFDGPGFCVGGDACYHPVLDRTVSVRESQVLAGYPIGYAFAGKSAAQKYPQINQAVTPPAGAWLASIVAPGIDRATPRGAGPGQIRVIDLVDRKGPSRSELIEIA
jgi:DNA (cytosine-5)-methyltransferase 1